MCILDSIDVLHSDICFLQMFFPLNNVPVVCVQHESLGPTGGFSNYVFKKLHESKQFSELLRLGEEFPEELSIFLKEHSDLLWLHDLFLHHFSSASETLHELALTQNMQSTTVTEEEEQVHMKLKLSDRKNLLYLSKIAAFAGMASV
jgi:nuclear pore complex protein Nup133